MLVDILLKEGVASQSIRNFQKYCDEAVLEHCLFEIPNRKIEFSVFNHTDLKSSNFLIRYNASGEPTSAKLIDYQMSLVGSPVFDVIFFLIISTELPVFEQHSVVMKNMYLAALNDSLAQLNYHGEYTKSNFTDDEQSVRLYQFFCLLWLGYLSIKTVIKNFDRDKKYFKILTSAEVDKVLASDKFRNGFLSWFRYFEKTQLLGE